MTTAAGQPARIVRSKSIAELAHAWRRDRRCSACHSSRRVRMPTASATDSVPGRMPACWKPPKSCGCEFDAVADDECADAERAVEFVGGDGHRGDAEFAEIDRQFADDLGGVGVERDAVLGCRSRRIRRRVESRRFRCWPSIAATRRVSGRSRSRQVVDADDAVWIDARGGRFAWPCAASWSARAAMLGCSSGGDDEMRVDAGRGRPGSRSDVKEAADREVVGFGAAAGEDHVVGVAAGGVRTEEFADALAGIFEHAAGPAAEFVLAGGVQYGSA